MNLLKSALAFLCLLFAVRHPYVHLFQVDFGLWGGGLLKWKIVENYSLALGRRKWKCQGGYPTLTHGGLSLLETLSPFIELEKR